MKHTLSMLALALAALTAPLAQAQPAVTGSSVTPLADDTLYRAFGGEPGLNKLMDDFVDRLARDPRIGRFFTKPEVSLPRLKALLALQLCAVSGGPCQYTGRDMSASHAGMGVDKSHFNALVEVLQQSMDAQGIPFTAQNRMLAQLAPMHRDVITQ